MTGGELLARCLAEQGVERAFCVPGESYLALLDGLHGGPIDVVNARHEGGAAMMAEADGKLTGRPGVCFVTRGPGATNASAGVHIAQQDSTPMVLFVGQIGRDMKGRDAFQEVDYRAFYGSMAKWVAEIDNPDRIPEIVSHAWHVAMSGRPGPVVIALPEDMLRQAAAARPGPRVEVASPAPDAAGMAELGRLLAAAEAPVAVLGGSRWTPEDVAAMARFAESWDLPVACSFRRQMLFDAHHPNYAGDIGLGPNPKLTARIASSDLVLLIGARFSENPSQGFSLFDIPRPRQRLVHVHPGPEELGRIYVPALPVNATPGTFLAAAPQGPGGNGARAAEAHADYLAWSETVRPNPGRVQLAEMMAYLRDRLPEDAVLTNGAGNYASWLHRFYRYRRFGTQLGPTSGSMGYGLPAAVAAKLRRPEVPVVCFAGDGCFQMHGFEFGTAVQAAAAVVVVVIDNGIYGTIRMHQEREYPGRVSATTLVNPDFAALARAFGGHGETVTETAEFAPAFERALAAGRPALVHVCIDPEAITPTTTLSALRSAGSRH